MGYANIRDILGNFIGKRVLDITQHDQDEYRDGDCYVMLMFEDGSYIRFNQGSEGFSVSEE